MASASLHSMFTTHSTKAAKPASGKKLRRNSHVARMSALLAGLPPSVPAATVNRLCGSGMNAIGNAAHAIAAGDAELIIAGGVESMSRAPFVLAKSTQPFGRNAEIYDTTLRDGSQQEGISLTVGDKLRIASLLDELGVSYVEGGWPGANPKDDEFFQRARTELDFNHAELVAFGSTRRPRGDVASDPQLAALLAADTETICIVGKAWDYHVLEALRSDLDEGRRMVAESIEFLRSKDRRVFFDAEHFFDGYRANPEFSIGILRAAAESGAERLVLCDTNGGTLPGEVNRIVSEVQGALPEAAIGVHFHNDVGCAVASTLQADVSAVASSRFELSSQASRRLEESSLRLLRRSRNPRRWSPGSKPGI